MKNNMLKQQKVMTKAMNKQMDFADQAIVPMQSAQINVMNERPILQSIQADINSNLGVQVYNLPTRFTIPSNRDPKPIHLLKEELPSILQYFWSCSSPNRVLVNNKIRNRDHLILPGDAKIYVNDEFIGTCELGLIAPNQEFKLGERITYDIRIKKLMKAKKKEKEGVFKGKNAMTYEYSIEIENLKNVNDELIMYERIPHSVSEKIKVKFLEISETPSTNLLNVLKWVIKMDKVQRKKIIKYSYQVISDKDISIVPPLP